MEIRVKKIISNVLNTNSNQIGTNSNLIEMGMESLQFIDIIVELETEFSIEFDDNVLISSRLNTVDKIIDEIKKSMYKS